MDRIRKVFLVTLVLIVVGASVVAAAPTAYVMNFADGFSVINTGTNVVATVADYVGVGPQAVAITPDGRFAYVANFTSGTVSVINTATNTVVGMPVTVGSGPSAVAITPDGSFAYVTAFGGCANGGVWVIDTAKAINEPEKAVVATVLLGGCATGVAITPNGVFAYVANFSLNNVAVIATTTNPVTNPPAVVATVPVGAGPQGVAVTPDGALAYVTNRDSNSVSVIATTADPATNPPTVVATVGVGSSPQGVAITPDGAFAYVANFTPSNPPVIGNVSVIATALINTGQDPMVATVPVGVNPWGVAITPDGAFAYVTNNISDSVSVIDTATRAVVAEKTVALPAGVGPRGIAIANLDSTPPETSISSGPAEASITNSTGAMFAFTGTDNVTATSALAFKCSLDGTAETSCASPQTYSSLAEGQHTFAVSAIDEARNVDPTPAMRTWTVDLTPPTTSISSGPAEGFITNSTQATFSFAGTDDRTASSALTFRCSLDGGSSAGCASPQTYSGLAEGQHTFAVRAVDEAGNIDPASAMRTWTIDLTPPLLFLSVTPNVLWPPNHQLIEVTVAVSATDNVGVASVVLSKVECSELGQAACPADVIQGADIGTLDTQILLRSERTGGSERRYTLTYLATDLAGNTVTATATVVVSKSP